MLTRKRFGHIRSWKRIDFDGGLGSASGIRE